MSRHQPTLDEVSSTYGAPMGRPCWIGNPVNRCHLFRVKLDSGGYDQGGAYWGAGQPLWCLTDGTEFRWFCRAPTRREAWKLALEEWPGYEFKLLKPIKL